MASYTDPETKQWESPGGWGARHINDTAPFTLWDDANRKFCWPSKEEWIWIWERSGGENVYFNGWLMCFETHAPTKPIPLTLGTLPVMFVRPGEMFFDPIPESGYSNPRVPDPCPTLRWPKMTNPSNSQMEAILEAMTPLAHVRAAIFLPMWTIFELETGDDRSYKRLSLLGVVAGRTALYHHEDLPFLGPMRSLTHPRLNDASQESTARDNIEPAGGRKEAIEMMDSGRRKRLRKQPSEWSNDTSLAYQKPSQLSTDTLQDNTSYLHYSILTLGREIECSFRIPGTSKESIQGSEPALGSWHEVDGMSSGLFSIMNAGVAVMKSARPIGHPEIDFSRWNVRFVNFMFGKVDQDMSDGLCGAPIADADTGGVAGFFHQANGFWGFSAVLDDLVDEGWVLM
ncbi:unnamed protein product [Penicillium salamii]|uniref:Uncharacterized protein n=1 Tax=Penicillium salamii TaxID=1612424 RepID=A0A9W4IXD5_9EURO|nr:unnamed protein product [Penicillium salamii]